MAKKLILGNWKMHGLQAEARSLAQAIATCKAPASAEIVLFPPATALACVAQTLQKSHVLLGGQDCSAETEGAYTGDISANMLKDAGCTYVIVGHSERRQMHEESNTLVKAKAESALKAGLTAVICVGEDKIEREKGIYLEVIEEQLQKSIPNPSMSGAYVIAYEPVWAIGSGKTPTTSQIAEVHKTIAQALSYATSGARRMIVYGGSVKAANAREILSIEGVDGVLAGGASLKAEEFCAIIAAAQG